MESFWQDLRSSVRIVTRSPRFAVVVVAILALGIGANTAIWSVVEALLLRPLPYRDPGRLVSIWSTEAEQGGAPQPTAAPDFREWRSQNHVFTDVAAFRYESLNLTTSGGEAERLQSARVSANLFALLGVAPALGRDLLPEEERFGRHRVALISHALWQRRFAADPGLVGRTIELGGVRHRVAGVMPQGMPFLADVPPVDVWAPLAFAAGDNDDTRNNRFLRVIARLKPGVELGRARAEMAAIARRIEQQYKENAGIGTRVVPLAAELVRTVRPALLVLLGAVGFLLLVACVNVSGVFLAFLARTLERQKELAVRAAMGAGPGRLARQLLLESLTVGLLGGAAGCGLAAWGMSSLVALLPASLPRFNQIHLDSGVFLYALGSTILTAVLAGLVPAVQARRSDLQEVLREGGRSVAGGRRQRRLRGLLVVAEVGLALTLLSCAGLLAKSFLRLVQVDPGFAARGVLTLQIPLADGKYPPPNQARPYPGAAIAFLDQVVERVRALPGVHAAGLTSTLPLRNGVGWTKYLSVAGGPVPRSLGEVPLVYFVLAGPGYLDTVGARLRQGRLLDAHDDRRAQPVAVVNESFARRLLGGGDPVGRTIVLDAPPHLLPAPLPGELPAPRRKIVGMIADIKNAGLDRPAEPEVFVPLTQCVAEGWSNTVRLAVRTAADPLRVANAIRGEVVALDPQQPVARVSTLADLLGDALSQMRFSLLLLGFFAVAALGLAALGIYGVISYSVRQRAHEVGVRMALGARRWEVLRQVIGEGIRLTAGGLLLGIVGSLAFTRLLAGLLFEVRPADPWVLALVSALLAATALLACYLPARRATRVDPVLVLRCG